MNLGYHAYYGLGFDGTTTREVVTDISIPNAQSVYSYCIWLNTDDTANWRRAWSSLVATNGAGHLLQIGGSGIWAGKFRWTAYYSGIKFDAISTTSPSTNTWYHVTFVRSGTNLKVYIGDSTNSLSLQMNVTNSQLSQTFGGSYFLLNMFPSSSPTYWPTGSSYLPGLGDIDELAVFHSALTQSQITNIYKGESDGGSGGTNGTKGDLTSFDPVVWYRMGDGDEAGSGSTVYDMSANSYNATLYNSPSYTSY